MAGSNARGIAIHMHTLYYAPGSASMLVHWLLIPHELALVDIAAGEHKRPAYLALNPNGVALRLWV